MHRKAFQRMFIFALVFLCLWSGIVCAQAASKKLKSIKLPSVVVVVKGKKVTVKPTLAPAGVKAKIKWSSGKKSIAKVSSKGVVTGKKVGETVIKATSGKVKATTVVRVVSKVGLYTTGGKTYYCDPATGLLAKGMTTVKGKAYYFDAKTGVQKTGLIKAGDGNTYNFLKKGGVSKGRATVNKKEYCFDRTDGHMLTGLQTVGEKTFYFKPGTSVMQTGP